MYSNYGTPTLRNATFSGNSASVLGGGMYSLGSLTLRNAILWGNGPSQFFGGATFFDSVVQGGCPGGCTCTHVIDADPHLGALGNWGGATQTVPLLPGSSAIDAGDNAACPPADQRGVPRPQGAGCDIGAYESRGFHLALAGGDGQVAAIYTPFAQPLSVSNDDGDTLDGAVVTFLAPPSGASLVPVADR